MNEMAVFLLSVGTVGVLAFALLFAIGVIWRVEMELDASYKFFGWALFLLILSEVGALVPSYRTGMVFEVSVAFVRLLAALFFLVGVLLMRDIVRKLDGETKPDAGRKT